MPQNALGHQGEALLKRLREWCERLRLECHVETLDELFACCNDASLASLCLLTEDSLPVEEAFQALTSKVGKQLSALPPPGPALPRTERDHFLTGPSPVTAALSSWPRWRHHSLFCGALC